MQIDYSGEKPKYYDENGAEIHDGDTVLMDGREWKVMETCDGYLGVDSTNPTWIAMGRAAEGEFGIYQFSECDNPILRLNSEI